MRTNALILADLALNAGGLRAAARLSGVGVSTVSSALGRLESELGVVLARRTDEGLAHSVEATRHAAGIRRVAALCAEIHGLPAGGVPARSVGLDALFRLAETLRVGSIRKAAQRMQMAQPHLTRQLAQIETALDTALLDRTSGGISATQAGAALAARIERLDHEWRALTGRPEPHHSTRSRQYALGTIIPADPRGALAGLIALIARELMLAQPLHLAIASSTAEELLHGLDAGRYDAVLIDARPDGDGDRGDAAGPYRHAELGRGMLALFGAHVPAGENGGTAALRAALAKQPLAVQSRRSGLRQRAETFLDDAAGPGWRDLTRIIEVDSLPVLVRLVRDGAAASVLPAASAQALAGVPRLMLPAGCGQILWLTWRARPRSERLAAQIMAAVAGAVTAPGTLDSDGP